MKTIDEILSKYSRTDEGNGFYDKDVWEAMEEYAQSNKPKVVTDQEIEAWAFSDTSDTSDPFVLDLVVISKIKGAKAMRDGKIKAILI